MNRRQMFMDGYENGVADAQNILIAARQWHGMSVQDVLQKLDYEMDKLRLYSHSKGDK